MQATQNPTQAASMQVRGDFVMLRADELRLLLPQHDVNVSEYLEQAPIPTTDAGIFALGEVDGRQQWVAALSGQMVLLNEFPAGRFVLTRLRGRQDLLLAWDEVRVIMDTSFEFHPIPEVLRGRAGLVDAYVVLDDGAVAFCTTASRVLAESDFGHAATTGPEQTVPA